MLKEQIKFKPFLQESDRPLKGNLCVIEIHDNHLTTYDSYTYEQQDDESYIPRKTFSLSTYLRTSIYELSFYWDNDQQGFFLDINGNCWGFIDEQEGTAVYEKIQSWLCA